MGSKMMQVSLRVVLKRKPCSLRPLVVMLHCKLGFDRHRYRLVHCVTHAAKERGEKKLFVAKARSSSLGAG